MSLRRWRCTCPCHTGEVKHVGPCRCEPEPQTITCPFCGMTSTNPGDVRERYCGHCHRFLDGRDRPCEHYHAEQTTGADGLPRTGPRRYCLRPAVDWSTLPRCEHHVGTVTGQDLIDHPELKEED